MARSRSNQAASPYLMVLVTFSVLSGIFAMTGCGGGGGGGGPETAFSNGGGDSTFFLEEMFFGRPLIDPSGNVYQVINPASLIETDPITGIIIDGYPKALFTGEDLGQLGSFNLEETPNSSYKVKIIPRNAAIMLDFTLPVDPGCMNLDGNNRLTSKSPIRIFNDSGVPIELEAMVWGDKVILNPVVDDTIGFPASPLLFDSDGNPMGTPDGFLKTHVISAGTGNNVVLSVDGRQLSARADLLGAPSKPVGFNPGNTKLDFINYGDITFNGFLPDLTAPRIIREVCDSGTAGNGSDTFTIVDSSKSFVTAANNGYGEWAGGLITLRPGDPYEEKLKVLTNTADTLTVAGGFTVPPVAGQDEYELQRAEFFEPIPGLVDLTTAVDPVNYPKDPFDPEDFKNSDLFNFVFFDEYDSGQEVWSSVAYDPGPDGTNPVNPNWRIKLRFSEPMDVDSCRTYESFYVAEASVSIEDPGFGKMKTGQVVGLAGNKVIAFEPVLEDQYAGMGVPSVGDRLLGFGGKPKALRLVIRVVPPSKNIQDFYESLGPNQSEWPAGVIADLDKEGVLGIINLGGQPLGLPLQFLDKGSNHCVAYLDSTGHGAYPPAVDLKYEFNTQATSDPEYGTIVHRFMGLPETGVGGNPVITGVIYNDHPGEIYGPHIADTSVGLNGFLSGHAVEFIEHVFDDYNHPPPSSKGLIDNTYPDPIFKIPFGVGTPITAGDGARFQHVYRRADCSPDVPALEGTTLDLIGLSWAPIGGWVTSTLVEEMCIVVGDCNSTIKPNTHQSAGIPDQTASGLKQTFVTNYDDPNGENGVVLGEYNPLGPDQGVPYKVDWRDLYAPKNAGKNFNNYLAWPAFDKPEEAPGFGFQSRLHMLIEYRLDPNETSGLALTNGFSFHAGIISSMLPRFRVYTRGNAYQSNGQYIPRFMELHCPGTLPRRWALCRIRELMATIRGTS